MLSPTDSGVPVMTEFEPVDDLSGIEDPVPLSTEGRTVACVGEMSKCNFSKQ